MCKIEFEFESEYFVHLIKMLKLLQIKIKLYNKLPKKINRWHPL